MKRWTVEEENFLRENYPKLKYNELAKKLNKTKSSVDHKIIRMKLDKKRKRFTKEEEKLLRKNYANSDSKELAKKLQRKRSSVFYKSNYLKINKNPKIMHTVGFKAIIDGLLLGDGCIIDSSKTSGIFVINQREDRLQWLQELQKSLSKYNVESKIEDGCKAKEITILGKKTKQRKSYVLRTKSYPTFLRYRKRWYPEGKKIVPTDVILSPIALAQWYMSDGHRFTSKKSNGLNIYCDGFQRKDVEFLRDRLNAQYRLSFHLWNVRTVLQLSRKKHVEIFLRITKPYKMDCFNYKWRNNYENTIVNK
jgi:hypothetical protein